MQSANPLSRFLASVPGNFGSISQYSREEGATTNPTRAYGASGIFDPYIVNGLRLLRGKQLLPSEETVAALKDFESIVRSPLS